MHCIFWYRYWYVLYRYNVGFMFRRYIHSEIPFRRWVMVPVDGCWSTTNLCSALETFGILHGIWIVCLHERKLLLLKCIVMTLESLPWILIWFWEKDILHGGISLQGSSIWNMNAGFYDMNVLKTECFGGFEICWILKRDIWLENQRSFLRHMWDVVYAEMCIQCFGLVFGIYSGSFLWYLITFFSVIYFGCEYWNEGVSIVFLLMLWIYKARIVIDML